MYKQWVIITAVVMAVGCADTAKKPEEAESRYRAQTPHRDLQEDMRRTEMMHNDKSIPNVRRLYNTRNIMFDPHDREQKRIIEDFLNPDYAPEVQKFDFRYLKSGGRDFTRAEGGQIIILPKGLRSKEHKDYPFDNYDELLEFLRLKKIAELEKKRLHEEDYHHVRPSHPHIPLHHRDEHEHPLARGHGHVPRKQAPIIHKQLHHEDDVDSHAHRNYHH